MRVQMLFRLSLGALLSQLRRARPSGAIKTSGAPSAAGGQKEWRSTPLRPQRPQVRRGRGAHLKHKAPPATVRPTVERHSF